MIRRLLIWQTIRATFSYPRVNGYILLFGLPGAVWIGEHETLWPVLVWLVLGLLVVRFTLSEDEKRGGCNA